MPKAKSPLLSKFSQVMSLKVPIGPPLPRRELAKLLNRIKAVLEQIIVALEVEDTPAPPARPRARKTASRRQSRGK